MAKEVLRYGYGEAESVSDAPLSDEIDLRALVRAIWRRKFLIMATVLTITGLAAAYVSNITPLYTASTLLRLETRESEVIKVDQVLEQLQTDPATIDSELEFLRSVAFARSAVNDLGLMNDPEFNSTLRPVEPSWTDWLDPARYIPASWLAALQPAPAEEIDAPAGYYESDPQALLERNVVSRFLGRIEAEQVGRSYVVSLSVSSEDPGKAARLANALADHYLLKQVEQKYEASRQAVVWLEDRVRELRAKVLESERKLTEYKNANRLSDTTGENPVLMQMSEINTQLALSSAQRAEAEARVNQAQDVLNSAGGVAAALKVLTSPLLTELRSQESELIRKVAELSTSYGDRHPQMVSLRGDIGSLRGKMRDEVERIMQDLQNEVAIARARESQLQSSLNALEGQADTQQVASVELHDLAIEAEANRELFQTFLLRFNEINEAQQLQQADIKVLSPADVPLDPSYPRKKLFVAIAMLGSGMLALLLVFVVERWDADYGFRSADEILGATGLRALALVPDVGKRDTQGVAPEDYILQKPNSAFGEALQRVRTSLFLTHEGQDPTRTLLITSSVPLEGKSLIAASLARQSARSGLRTLLIDGDLRRPRLHEVVRVANQSGLSELLSGKILPEEAIRVDEKSGMDFIPAGIGAASPPDMFRAQAMRQFLDQMRERYDLVVFDSPPVAAVSDSFILSGLVDKTLFVVRWETTPRNVVMAGVRQLVESGGEIAGIVLSRVDVKKHANYGYADSGYYAGYYRKYYVN
jgi:capsular exopolysaccharide synthesis family protein